MTQLISFLDKFSGAANVPDQQLERVRLSADQTVVVLITQNTAELKTHYLRYGALNDYVRCNGADCVLCKIGVTAEDRNLLPVLDVAQQQVRVLLVSETKTPSALGPKLCETLQKDDWDRRFVSISRQGTTFQVSSTLASPDHDLGQSLTSAFLSRLEAGEVELESVVVRLSNEQLADIPEIANLLSARGGAAT